MRLSAVMPRIGIRDTSPTEVKTRKSTNGGYSLTSRPSPASCLLSDDQIREARWLREYRGWAISKLAEKYQVKAANMRNVCDYVTRGKISVKPDSFADSHFQ